MDGWTTRPRRLYAPPGEPGKETEPHNANPPDGPAGNATARRRHHPGKRACPMPRLTATPHPKGAHRVATASTRTGNIGPAGDTRRVVPDDRRRGVTLSFHCSPTARPTAEGSNRSGLGHSNSPTASARVGSRESARDPVSHNISAHPESAADRLQIYDPSARRSTRSSGWSRAAGAG